jgi:hypothetical protein
MRIEFRRIPDDILQLEGWRNASGRGLEVKVDVVGGQSLELKLAVEDSDVFVPGQKVGDVVGSVGEIELVETARRLNGVLLELTRYIPDMTRIPPLWKKWLADYSSAAVTSHGLLSMAVGVSSDPWPAFVADWHEAEPGESDDFVAVHADGSRSFHYATAKAAFVAAVESLGVPVGIVFAERTGTDATRRIVIYR